MKLNDWNNSAVWHYSPIFYTNILFSTITIIQEVFKMYGWRARIGAIVPSTNTAVESEFNTMKPEGVSIHASRMVSLENSVEILFNLAKDTERASYELGTTMCNTIVYACTSGSFVGGPKWEQELVERMEKASGTKAITTSGAVVRALKQLGVKKSV